MGTHFGTYVKVNSFRFRNFSLTTRQRKNSLIAAAKYLCCLPLGNGNRILHRYLAKRDLLVRLLQLHLDQGDDPMRPLNYSALLLLSGLLNAIQAEVMIPVQATLSTRTFQVNSDGTRTLLEVQEGLFARNSEGSELRRLRSSKDGAATGQDISMLQDFKSKAVYRIDHRPRKTVRLQDLPPEFPVRISTRTSPKPEQILGDETISGIRCKKIAGRSHSQRHNLTYISFDYDLIVKSEHEFSSPDGARFFQVTELSGIRTGAEPDPALFTLPADYQLLTAEDTKSRCDSCARPK